MSMTYKILSNHLSKDRSLQSIKKTSSDSSMNHSLEPGEIIECDIDFTMVHEQLGGRINKEYYKLGLDYVKNPDKIAFILDHWVPNPDLRAAKMHQDANLFAKQYKFTNILGENKGICHTVIPERGFVSPGMIAVGSDSHTTTYGAFNSFSTGIGASDVCYVFATGKLWFKVPECWKISLKNNFPKGTYAKDLVLEMLKVIRTDGAIYKSLEFFGDGLKNLPVSARITIANMAVEMGAKNAIFPGDKILRNWFENNPYYQKRHGRDDPISPTNPNSIDPTNKTNTAIKTNITKPINFITPSAGFEYEKEMEFDLNDLSPLVAIPHEPDNVKRVDELDKIELDQCFIGSCTNGSYDDLEAAARIFRNQKVKEGLRCIVIPASMEIYKKAMKNGLLEIFIDAGCVIGPPTCGPCIGGHMGVLGDDEVCISTTNRNFKGRMGSKSSKIYLASPSTAAASAITGYITSELQLQ